MIFAVNFLNTISLHLKMKIIIGLVIVFLAVMTSSCSAGGGGAVYTHWGSKRCPDGAELVYSGKPLLHYLLEVLFFSGCVSDVLPFTLLGSNGNSTTVIVKIKGKLRSLFCNTRTAIEKLMHVIIYTENKSVVTM
jgi:hypothetical protein